MYPKMEMQNNTEYRNSFSHSSRPLTKSDFKNGRNIEYLQIYIYNFEFT